MQADLIKRAARMIRSLALGLTLGLAVAAAPAVAQIPSLPGGLPGGLPSLPSTPRGVPDLPRSIDGTRNRVDALLRAPGRLDQLVRRNRDVLDVDPFGWPVIRAEILATGLDERARAAALAAGFTIAREESLGSLGLSITVLTPPRGLSLERAVRRLRETAPEAEVEYNHLYVGAGSPNPTTEPAPMPVAPPRQSSARRIGLIDTGVDGSHPSLGGRVTARGFAGAVRPAAHGTAVASLLAGRAGAFHGASPLAQVYAADVYGPRGLGGSADAVARALAWMVDSDVPVVNISLVGPRNSLIQAATAAAISRGLIVVAAVGNDGPAAPPLYPAGYPGVVGVTAVNGRHRLLPEAGRGDQVDFTAPGADMAAAAMGGGYTGVRGTSFAAPIVAGLLAEQAGRSSGAAGAVRALGGLARDLGPPGSDPMYGLGLVGAEIRVAPGDVSARGQLIR